MAVWKPFSYAERRDMVTELRKEAQELLDEAERIQKGLDADEEEIWRAVQKHKELLTRDAS